MNYTEIQETKKSDYVIKLLAGESVSRFAVYPYRKELRHALRFDPEALEYLESLIESVEETI